MNETRLRRVAQVTPSNVDKKTVDGQEPIQLCNYTDVYKNDFISSQMKFMTATASVSQIETFTLQRGDVILTKDSETWDDIAVPALVTEDLFGTLCGYHLALIRPDRKRVEPRYLFRALSTRYVNRQFQIGATGVTRYGLRTDVIRDARIPLPDLGQQGLIADFLDRETHRIDALVDAKRRLIDLLAEKRTALITHVATKGLDPSVPMKESESEWIGEIPSTWDVVTLKRVAKVRYGLGQPPPASESGIPIIRATNIERGRVNPANLIHADLYDIPTERAPLLQTGEILVVRSGAYTGDSAIIPDEYSGAAPGYDLRVTVTKANAEYVAWYLLSKAALRQIHLQSTRAAQPHLNAEELAEVIIPLPPAEEQKAVANRLDIVMGHLQVLNLAMQAQLALLAEYRHALITAAVTGQLDEATLRGHQPADEVMEFEVQA